MLGLMQDFPLTIDYILRRGERMYPDRSITTGLVEGQERISFAELATRSRQVAGVLDRLGVSPDGRVGSFGWNTANHTALYFGVPGTGRVLHTLNIRLFPEQLIYTVEHAEDEVVFVDRSLLPLFGQYLAKLGTVRHVVVFDDGSPAELPEDSRVLRWQDVAGDELDYAGMVTDEQTAAALCYTTGTTGNPKGVYFTHRQLVLHTMGMATVVGLSAAVALRLLGLGAGIAIAPLRRLFHA